MGDMNFLDDAVAARLTAKLVELQGTQKDADFAVILGVSRPHWWNVRSGRRRPSYELIKRACLRYPELSVIVLRDLSEPAATT